MSSVRLSSRRRTGWLTACVLLGALGLAPAAALGQGASAKQAYEAATQAFAAKHYPEAAAGFAQADALEPNPIALESALKAALLADDPILGMALVARAEARPVDARVDGVKRRARAAFEKRVGRVELRCGENKTCFAKIDPGGRALEPGQTLWVPVGDALVTVTSDAGHGTEHLTITADSLVAIQAPAPRAPAHAPAVPSSSALEPAPAAPPFAPPASTSALPAAPASPAQAPAESVSSGLSPVWFVISAVATSGLVAGTVASGVDTLGLHDDYFAGDDGALESGRSAQLRTNVLLGVTLTAAAATTLIAIFTDWGGASVALSPGGARVGLRF